MSLTKKHIVAIINPISGIRPKEHIPALIREQIDAERFDIRIVMTEYAGHATEIARQAVADGVDYVLAIGGDGTINETAKALIHSQTALGIIPLGSGNGLARHLQIPLETAKALKIVEEENVIAIDYCRANDHIFFCTAGVGFDAWISKKFAEDKHRGTLTYAKNVLAEYLSYQPRRYKIVMSGGSVVERAFLVAFANASQYGNNAYIAPSASMQDGMMDITVLRPFKHIEAPVLSLQLFTKQLTKNGRIQSFRDSDVTVILDKPEVMHVDGEPIMMDKEIHVKTIPAGLRVLVPTHPSHSLIEPMRHAIEEIHYNILNDVREAIQKISNG
jgi:YegS/Rv2252/BmrU family lipid kinase